MRNLIIIFLLIAIGGQIYICWRVWNILPLATGWRIAVVGIMTAAFFSFFLAILIPIDRIPFSVAVTVYQGGTSWLFIMLYLVFIFLIIDIGHIFHLIPTSFIHHSWKGSLSVTALMLALFTGGYIHHINKVRQPLTVKSHKTILQPLKIVMVSDLHLGYINRKDDLRRWIRLINAERPDIILFCGDIVDYGIHSITYQNMADDFHRLKAPLYACLGNHEYLADQTGSIKFYSDAGIHLLRDSSVTVKGINIIGRDDRSNFHRKSMMRLTSGIDKSRFTILLDHQPNNLEEARQAGIDLQLSGHTHYGQLWPISWITDAMYEDAFGPLTKGKTQYYVTSGIGIWGGKFRIGTRSEYVVITISSD